jgi:Domain of unknown function (DUF5668)
VAGPPASAYPPRPEPAAEPRRGRARRSGIVWPLIFILVGSVFLLQNLGVLPPTTWLGLWRVWPLLLVLVGVELLLGHRGYLAALVGLVVAIVALGLVAGAIDLPGLSAPRQASGTVTSRAETQPLRGANQAVVTLRFGAGQLDVGPFLNAGPDDLASMTYDGPPEAAPEAQYSVADGIGRLNYQLSGRASGFVPFFAGRGDGGEARLDVNLRPNLPLSLTVQTGATQAWLDLSQLRVGTLDVAMGAADTWVRLPEAAGTTTAHFSGGATSLRLEIPNGVAAQIRTRGGLNTVSVDQSRFPAAGSDLYRSPDYSTAQNKVDITVETGVSTIRVT